MLQLEIARDIHYFRLLNVRNGRPSLLCFPCTASGAMRRGLAFKPYLAAGIRGNAEVSVQTRAIKNVYK
jgi:hypothetical protein